MKPYLCPVCEKHYFEKEDDYAFCPNCKWENDGVQGRDHDFWGGANHLSVNEEKIFYKLSKCKEISDDLQILYNNHRNIIETIAVKYVSANYLIEGDKIYSEYKDEHDRFVSKLIELQNRVKK